MGVLNTKPANLTNRSISDYAEKIGRHHSVYHEGRADLDALLRRLGGKVAYAESEESLQVRQEGVFTVFLPHFTSVSRDRFTIAHELGHYFLHYRLAGLSGTKSYGRGARNRAETEANVFASALLMPELEFRKWWGQAAGDEWQVARHFEVSPSAAAVRAQVLGLA